MFGSYDLSNLKIESHKKDLEVKLIQVQIEKSIESIGSFVSFDSEMTSN